MPQRHLLVVEDDDTIRRLLAEYLGASADVNVDTARDGAEALHHVSSKRYSAVVLDVMMPHMSGIDFLESLQALCFDPSVKSLETPPPVVVITSACPDVLPSAEIEHRFPALVRGVLRKPLDLGDVTRCLEAVL